MGGCSSLLCTRYARRKVAACLANCPVCDAAFHFNARPDLPKTFGHAFRGYPEGLDTALAKHLPLRQVPQSPTHLCCTAGRTRPSTKAPLRRLRGGHEGGRAKGQYVEVPAMGHCGPMLIDMLQRTIEFVADILDGGRARLSRAS